MNGWWMLANLVLAAHILLFVLLALGVVLALHLGTLLDIPTVGGPQRLRGSDVPAPATLRDPCASRQHRTN